MEGTPVQPVAIMGGTFPYRDNGRSHGGIALWHAGSTSALIERPQNRRPILAFPYQSG